MIIIKLDAIDSTNDFLKNLYKNSVVENFTMVVANSQTNGKGQRGSTWTSEAGKNIIMSVLLKDLIVNSEQIFDLNVIVSLSVFQVLKSSNLSNLSIKWPNDIMSDSKKIGGILIENIFKTDNTIVSIVGIGINVNQTDFSLLPKASSIKNSIGTSMDIDLLANAIRNKLYQNMEIMTTNSSLFWKMYEENLFKLNIPMVFEDIKKKRFMAIIKGVSSNGKLQLLLEDDSTVEYDIKEIQMLY